MVGLVHDWPQLDEIRTLRLVSNQRKARNRRNGRKRCRSLRCVGSRFDVQRRKLLSRRRHLRATEAERYTVESPVDAISALLRATGLRPLSQSTWWMTTATAAQRHPRSLISSVSPSHHRRHTETCRHDVSMTSMTPRRRRQQVRQWIVSSVTSPPARTPHCMPGRDGTALHGSLQLSASAPAYVITFTPDEQRQRARPAADWPTERHRNMESG